MQIKDLLAQNALPLNEECYLSGNYYVVGLAKYAVSMDTIKFEELLNKQKSSFPDFKAISHALRAGYQLRDIFLLGDFEYPLKQTKFLLDVKLGKLDYITEVAPVLEGLVIELESYSITADLPDEVDTDFWDNFVYNVYTDNF